MLTISIFIFILKMTNVQSVTNGRSEIREIMEVNDE